MEATIKGILQAPTEDYYIADAQFVYRDQPKTDGFYVVLFLTDNQLRLLRGKELVPYRLGMLPRG